MKKTLFFLIAIISCTLIELYGQVIHVPANQPTIQAGIDIASDGDTVLVDTGTYFENINFRGKAITVASNFIDSGDTNDINHTIIDGSEPVHTDSASVVMFTSGEDTTSVLCGFTLTNGTGLYINALNRRMGGGIACLDAGGKIYNNKIIGNETVHDNEPGGGGIGAIFLAEETWIVIEGNIINGNKSISTGDFSFGGGIYMAANARIENNTIEYNECHCDLGKADGGGIMIESSPGGFDTVYLRYNLISYNIVSASIFGRGGGIFSISTNTFIFNNTITHNSVFGNVANGCGILCNSNRSLDITDNIIGFNTSITDFAWFGAGILCVYPQGDCNFRNNRFEGNAGPIYSIYPQLISQGNGGGLCILDPYYNKVIVDGNFYINDTAKLGGGFYIRDAWNLELSNNVFTDNFAYNGGAIRTFELPKNRIGSDIIAYGFDPLIVNNSFLRNSAINEGGAVFSSYIEFPPVIFNNIFWESSADSGGHDIYLDGSAEVVIANCVTTDTNILGNWTGKNNIYADPEYTDSLCHLDTLSPCLNKGLDSIMVDELWYYAPLHDLEGNPRPDSICNFFDIGAYERQDCYSVSVVSIDPPSSVLDLYVYPNPVSSLATIEFELAKSGTTNITIFDHLGQIVETIDQGNTQQGKHQLGWDASGLPNGIYFVQVRAGQEMATRKIVKMR